jgi:pyochelin biosynthetic protein PchC
LHTVLPALRGDYRAVESYRYRPGPPLNCPITVLMADDDPLVHRDEPRPGRKHTTAPFRLRIFSGGHFYLTAHIRAVTQQIAKHIEIATAPR